MTENILPSPLIKFSFSGLKTAVIQEIKGLKQPLDESTVQNISASFQQTVIDILVHKAFKACETYQCKTLVLSGGVVANKTLTNTFSSRATKTGAHRKAVGFR